MNQIKIAFFDIDGTLVDMNTGKISEMTMETLKRLQKNGIKICIATGRPVVNLPKFEEVEFDAFLTFNGSFCYDKSGVIFSNPIPDEDVQKIIQNATDMGRPISIATKDRVVSNGADDDLVEYYSLAHQKVVVADDFSDACQEKIYQLMMGGCEAEYGSILKGVKGARITAWWNRAVDIIPADGGKGNGIQKILDFYGLDKSDALAFGDGDNDIEMLQTVGTGVAMGNASLRLKEIADDICGPVSDDGIYQYCVDKGLI